MNDDDLIKTLRVTYKEKLPDKIVNLEIAWEDLLKKWDNENIESLHKLIHKLNGSSGSYGYPEISHVARELEVYLKELLENKKVPTTQQINEIETRLENIKAVINKIISNPE